MSTKTDQQLITLKDKVIVITGATGVLGEAFVAAVASAGAKVVLLGRNVERGNERVNYFRQQGFEVMFIAADVLKEEQLEAAAQQVIAAYGRIDGLVNGAGGNVKEAVVGPSDNLFSLNIDALKAVFDLNLYGTILPTIIFGKHMLANERGSIVNISSAASQQVLTRVLGYSLAKSSVDNFTRWMSVELALRHESKIRVNAIAPGFFLAEQNRALLQNEDGTLTARGESIIRNTPFKRFGEPAELGGALVWLLSDAASFVTGEVINVDGGFKVFSGV